MRRLMRAQHDGETSQSDWSEDEEVILFERFKQKTRSSWLNCALRDDEAVYWVSIGHYEKVAVGN